jgi:hypothetical protein
MLKIKPGEGFVINGDFYMLFKCKKDGKKVYCFIEFNKFGVVTDKHPRIEDAITELFQNKGLPNLVAKEIEVKQVPKYVCKFKNQR